MDNSINTYWSYIVKIYGHKESWKNGTLEFLDEDSEISDTNDFIGKYSSLQEAIRGFIFDELNNFSKVIVKFDDNDKKCFKLSSEIYYDIEENLINDVTLRKWKKGEVNTLIHANIDVTFVEKIERKASVDELSKIMIQFPDFIIDR